MAKLQFRNDFHRTRTVILVPDMEVGQSAELSASQITRAEKALCGMSDCRCSGMIGARNYTHCIERNYADNVIVVRRMR